MNATCNGTADAVSGDSFPADFLSEQQKLQGGLLVHFLLAFYSCCALVGICETYFVPSLHSISGRLPLSKDVVGAIIMAGGGAIPGFFTSCFGTFVTNNDLGLGTIMGSACFNTFVVIAACSVFADPDAALEWWPTSRDFFYFVLTAIAMIGVIEDTAIHWYEALLMLLMFTLYIIILVYNQRLKECWESLVGRLRKTIGNVRRFREEAMQERLNQECTQKITPTHKMTCYNGCDLESNSSDYSVTSQGKQKWPPTFVSELEEQHMSSSSTLTHVPSEGLTNQISTRQYECTNDGDKTGHHMHYDPKWPWQRPTNHSIVQTTWWVWNIPSSLLFSVTIPDCRRPKVEKFFIITFVMSIFYIGVITYLLTWMIDLIGHTFSLPDSVLGVTILAMGTAVPDLCCSVIVFRQGFSSMAIANGFGSNIIDILICLGLPWCIKAAFFTESGIIHTENQSFTYTSIYVISAIMLLYALLVVNRFRLNRMVGIASATFYVAFLVIAVILELKVVVPDIAVTLTKEC